MKISLFKNNFFSKTQFHYAAQIGFKLKSSSWIPSTGLQTGAGIRGMDHYT